MDQIGLFGTGKRCLVGFGCSWCDGMIPVPGGFRRMLWDGISGQIPIVVLSHGEIGCVCTEYFFAGFGFANDRSSLLGSSYLLRCIFYCATQESDLMQ